MTLGALALGLAVFGVIYATWETFWGDGRPVLQGNEDVGNYLWVRSLVIDGDLQFEDDLETTPALTAGAKETWIQTLRTSDGRLANPSPPGWSMVTLPAFLVGHALAVVTGAATDGWSRPYFFAVWVWHLVIAIGGWWAAWEVVSRYVRRDVAAVAVLALWIASPLVYYQTARVGIVHGLVFSLTAVVYYLTLRIRETPAQIWRWPVLGVAVALLLLTRMSAGVYLIFPLLVWWDLAHPPQQTPAPRGARISVGALAVVLFAGLLINGMAHGLTWAGAMPATVMNWEHPRLGAVLFSPMHGLFYWHPLVLVGLVGLAWGAYRGDLPWSWLISFALIYPVNAVWQWSWVGSGFGARGFDGAILFAMAGSGWLLGQFSRWFALRMMLWTGVVAGAALFALFMLQAIPRDEPVTYADMFGALWGLVWGG